MVLLFLIFPELGFDLPQVVFVPILLPQVLNHSDALVVEEIVNLLPSLLYSVAIDFYLSQLSLLFRLMLGHHLLQQLVHLLVHLEDALLIDLFHLHESGQVFLNGRRGGFIVNKSFPHKLGEVFTQPIPADKHIYPLLDLLVS